MKKQPRKREQKREMQPFGVCLNREAILKAMDRLNLNVAKLAAVSDLSVSMIQMALSEEKSRGLNPSLGAIVALAGTLEIPICEILIEISLKEHRRTLQRVHDLRYKSVDESYRRDYLTETLPVWAGKVQVTRG